MVNKLLEYIKENSLFENNDHILLAVSGGIDSVVLLDLFSKTDFKYSIAHFNFKLRGNESDTDEAFLKKLAVKYNSEIFINRCDAREYSVKEKLSIQEAARELRYSWFDKLCEEYSIQKIAIAHHNDDQIETFFINLFRGAGLAGLKGIPIKREKIIRPLLFAQRSEIEDYANQNNIEFREDSSNLSDKYLRNNIRHNIIPILSDLSPGFTGSISKSIDNLTDANELLNSVVEQKASELSKIGNDGTINLQIDELRKLNPFKIWMYYILSKFNFTRETTDDISNNLLHETNTGKLFESGNYQLLIDRERIILREKKNEIQSSTRLINNDTVSIESPLKINFKVVENSSDFKFKNNPDTAYFDYDKVVYPLTIRNWKKGDKITPFGMKGKKLVSDILIDCKTDMFTKENTYVIMSDDEIIWLVGYRSSNRFKVSENTSKILIATLHK